MANTAFPQHAAPEEAVVTDDVVVCDGGDGPLGHPRVWLHMEGAHYVDCPYCDKRFILKGHESEFTRAA